MGAGGPDRGQGQGRGPGPSHGAETEPLRPIPPSERAEAEATRAQSLQKTESPGQAVDHNERTHGICGLDRDW